MYPFLDEQGLYNAVMKIDLGLELKLAHFAIGTPCS